jgi:hypothetical protein
VAADDLTIACPAGADTAEGARKSGDYAIGWSGPEGANYRLVEHAADGKDILYEGPQLGSTVTGRLEGDYHYEVGLLEGGDVTHWSERCTVKVDPYPLSLALTFFAFGLVVTVATVALVIRGHRAHRRGEIG